MDQAIKLPYAFGMTAMPPLAAIRVFETVARHGNFSRAAAELNMTQSALSHSMRILEERMGVRLLARTTRGAAPTEAGERLVRVEQDPCRTTAGGSADDPCRPSDGQGGEG